VPLIDLRYPFGSAFEFFAGGYFYSPEAMHLSVAWFGMLGLITGVFLLLLRKVPLSLVAAILSLVLMPFTNPSFAIMGLFPSDFFALIATFSYCFESLLKPDRPIEISWQWVIFWCLVALHSGFVYVYYDLGDDKQLIHRLVLVVRPVISLIAATILFYGLKRVPVARLIFGIALVTSLLIGALVYGIQMVKFYNGVTPFGTMPSAGFGGIRFGGVSNEGGHLSKMTFPVLLAILVWIRGPSRVLLFCLFSAVFLLNVSATGYVSLGLFFILIPFFGVIALLKRLSARTIIVCLPLFVLLPAMLIPAHMVLSKVQIYSSLNHKIVDSVTRAWSPDIDQYGRSPLIAMAIIDRYPLGIGFAGSAQRNIVMSDFDFKAKENNLGVNVAMASWSYFMIPMLLFLFYKFTAGIWGASLIQKSIFLSLIFMMCIDVLWSSVGMFFMLLSATNPIEKRPTVCRSLEI
jgi:hypothetical protein